MRASTEVAAADPKHGVAGGALHLRALDLVLARGAPNIVGQFTRACGAIVIFASAMDWTVPRLAWVIALNVAVALAAIGLQWIQRALLSEKDGALP
jgi:hypothetical protein